MPQTSPTGPGPHGEPSPPTRQIEDARAAPRGAHASAARPPSPQAHAHTRPGEAASPPDPATLAERERGRRIGLAVIGAAAVIAFVVTVGIFIPALGAIVEQSRTQATTDPSSLPEGVLVCDREYLRATAPQVLTLAEVRASDGREPVVVRGAADAGCPTGVCVEGGLCLPVVYVSAGPDRYVAFELEESP